MSPEHRALQQAIRSRGQAPRREAADRTQSYLEDVLVEAGCAGSDVARRHATDWLRFFLVMGTTGWFKILDPLPEAQQLSLDPWTGS